MLEELVQCPICRRWFYSSSELFFHAWRLHIEKERSRLCWCTDKNGRRRAYPTWSSWSQHVHDAGGFDSHVLLGLFLDSLEL